MEYNSYKSHKLNAIIERSEDQDLSKLISLFENNYASPQCREVSWILDQPNLDEIQEVIQESLKANFSDVQINVVKCPDLRSFPYRLAASGLCGNAEVMEIGNHKRLYYPEGKNIPSWNLPNLISRFYKRNSSFVIGGSILHGIHTEDQSNEEIVVNVKYLRRYDKERNRFFAYPSPTIYNRNYLVGVEKGEIWPERRPDFQPIMCDLCGSFFVCSGRRKHVLEIYAKGANDSNKNILELMQEALCARYFNAHVGLSGTFFIKSGMVEASVIPATFPAIHLLTPTEIYNSSYKYQFSAPLVIYSTMFNFDKLYVESNSRQSKFYTVNDSSNQILPVRDKFEKMKDDRLKGERMIGGRFIKALTPLKMEYKGYFNVVTKLRRIGAEINSELFEDSDKFSKSDY